MWNELLAVNTTLGRDKSLTKKSIPSKLVLHFKISSCLGVSARCTQENCHVVSLLRNYMYTTLPNILPYAYIGLTQFIHLFLKTNICSARTNRDCEVVALFCSAFSFKHDTYIYLCFLLSSDIKY